MFCSYYRHKEEIEESAIVSVAYVTKISLIVNEIVFLYCDVKRIRSRILKKKKTFSEVEF